MDTNKHKGIIYMIKVGEDIYIGSTRQKYLCSRQAEHNRDLKKKKNFDLYIKCNELEIEEIECIFITNFYFDTIEEIRKEEEKYRIEYNATLNMKKCHTDLKGKDYSSRYYKDNNTKCLNYKKEKVICDVCNCEISRTHLARHKKTEKCKKLKVKKF